MVDDYLPDELTEKRYADDGKGGGSFIDRYVPERHCDPYDLKWSGASTHASSSSQADSKIAGVHRPAEPKNRRPHRAREAAPRGDH